MAVEVVDLSGISYFLPILSFLILFVLVFAVLKKTEVVENPWVQLFISFLMATVFVSTVGAREYVTTIVPWVGVLIVCLFFILVLIGFVGKELDFLHKGIGIGVVIALLAIFVISAIFVFSNFWNTNPSALDFKDWFLSSRVYGAFLLLLISAAASWVLVKGK